MGLKTVIVHIVSKPFDAWTRFKGCGTEIKVESGIEPEALHIPVDAFPSQQPRLVGHVILEANNLVDIGGKQIRTLESLIHERCPDIFVGSVDGDRGFARVRITLEDEALVKAVIKAIAKGLGRKASVREVPRSRQFDS